MRYDIYLMKNDVLNDLPRHFRWYANENDAWFYSKFDDPIQGNFQHLKWEREKTANAWMPFSVGIFVLVYKMCYRKLEKINHISVWRNTAIIMQYFSSFKFFVFFSVVVLLHSQKSSQVNVRKRREREPSVAMQANLAFLPSSHMDEHSIT